MNYLIIGAGAIGSVLGANLFQNGFQTQLVANQKHTEKINQNGLFVTTSEKKFNVKIPCFSELKNTKTNTDTIIFLTMKLDSRFEKTLQELKNLKLDSLPTVCFQNGVEAEKLAQKFLKNLYGGVARMTCTIKNFGEVIYEKQGSFVVGKFPEGSDKICQTVKNDLEKSGFQVGIAPKIIQDKFLKVLVNLNSVTHALFKDENPQKINEIKFFTLKEGVEVFQKAGILAFPSSGIGSTVEEMLLISEKTMKNPQKKQRFETYNSTWQNLYRQSAELENRYFNGLVIELGKKFGVQTPFNARLLELLEQLHKQKLPPNSLSLSEF
ncbi:ketopantoate reductase family protein [bacterium]|nr:ketopantoate reductase family protein [bacterium]